MDENYKEISDYGVIGNLRTAALVGRDGSIDWCCFPELDDPSVFAAILDHKKGGRFKIQPKGQSFSSQEYIGDTNILRTTFKRDGRKILTVTDFMPISGNINGRAAAKSIAPPIIARILECHIDDIVVDVEWSPRFDYGRSDTRIEKQGGQWTARDGKYILTLDGLENASVRKNENCDFIIAEFSMKRGHQMILSTLFGTDTPKIESVEKELYRTKKSWEQWTQLKGAGHNKSWAGEWLPMVERSELVFKILVNAHSGAVAAAPTTSLPETIGGVRNWDYRFSWLRDASLTAQALTAVGHNAEASDFMHWMEDVTSHAFKKGHDIPIMYGLHGRSDLTEIELGHLEGYRKSTPVRVGNEAAQQHQLETYGEVLNTAYELERRGERLNSHIRDFLRNVTEHVCNIWKEPDHGIWELRTGKKQLVYSKVMAWVTFDRAILLAEKFSLEGNVEKWKKSKREVQKDILNHGFNKELNSFVQSYDSDTIDASNLRIPLLEFLPFDDPRIQGTINKVQEQLTENCFVYRYLMDDGLPGKEGAFSLCTFWLIDNLAMSGRVDEACELYENMKKHANHVGLFSEQLDPETGRFLGNFPQAFTHIGLINSAFYLAYAMGRKVPEHTLMGTPTHRAFAGR